MGARGGASDKCHPAVRVILHLRPSPTVRLASWRVPNVLPPRRQNTCLGVSRAFASAFADGAPARLRFGDGRTRHRCSAALTRLLARRFSSQSPLRRSIARLASTPAYSNRLHCYRLNLLTQCGFERMSTIPVQRNVVCLQVCDLHQRVVALRIVGLVVFGDGELGEPGVDQRFVPSRSGIAA